MNVSFAAREPSAPPPPTRPRLGYEFTATQEIMIASLSRLMHIVGAASIVFALLLLLALSTGGVAVLAQSVVMIVIGALTYSVGTRFGRITTSTGTDIDHLMDALGGLRTMYLLQAWSLGLVAVILMLLVLMLFLG